MTKTNYPNGFYKPHDDRELTDDQINEMVQKAIENVRDLLRSGVEGVVFSRISNGRVLVQATSESETMIRVHVCQDYSETVVYRENEIIVP